MRHLPSSERPRERLARYGPEHLSNTELLAIIWRTGTSGNARESALDVASRALAPLRRPARPGPGRRRRADRLPGIGPGQGGRGPGGPRAGRRLRALDPEARPEVHSPRDVYHLVASEMAHLEREHLRVVLLNTKGRVLVVREVYRRDAQLRPRAHRRALPGGHQGEHRRSLIVVHNHPSGDPAPSPEDVRITADAARAGRLLDIEVLDHVVVGRPGPAGRATSRSRSAAWGSTEPASLSRDSEPERPTGAAVSPASFPGRLLGGEGDLVGLGVLRRMLSVVSRSCGWRR